MKFRLLLAFAVLFLGLWVVLGTTRDKFSIPSVERAELLIRTVRHGEIAPDASHSRAGVQLARTVNYVEKGALDHSNIEGRVFRIDPDGKTATQVAVRFGVVASELIEIQEGLQEGDQIIVSDMSRWLSVDRVRIE